MRIYGVCRKNMGSGLNYDLVARLKAKAVKPSKISKFHNTKLSLHVHYPLQYSVISSIMTSITDPIAAVVNGLPCDMSIRDGPFPPAGIEIEGEPNRNEKIVLLEISLFQLSPLLQHP